MTMIRATSRPLPPMPPAAKAIFLEEVEAAGACPHSVLGRFYFKDLVRVRHRVFARTHLEAGYNLTHVGRIFDRNHTSIRHAVGKWKEGKLA